MRRRELTAGLLAAVLSAPAAAAAGGTGAEAGVEENGDGSGPPVSEQEIGARLGIEAGGRVSPGGFHLGGAYLYRLADKDWLESGVSFTFGGSDAACFRDRDGDFLCDHGLLSGFAAEVSAGVRRFFRGRQGFVPFAGAGIAARLVSFTGDGVGGLALPLYATGGVRARVAERVAVLGGATVRGGVGFYDSNLGLEPHLTLAIHAGVEFGLR